MNNKFVAKELISVSREVEKKQSIEALQQIYRSLSLIQKSCELAKPISAGAWTSIAHITYWGNSVQFNVDTLSGNVYDIEKEMDKVKEALDLINKLARQNKET